MSLIDDNDRYIRDRTLEASRTLNEMLGIIQGKISDEEFEILRKCVGKIMGEIGVEVLFPIYDRRPDLAPEWFHKK
jgi:hypothetical protein